MGLNCQVLLNLVGNALKFTDKGYVLLEVTGRVMEEGRARIRIMVQDTGIGIPAEVQSRLFKSFSQADASTTRRFGGTGLGLSISRQLVNLMGGEIGVNSLPGEGATFWAELTLPVTAAPEPLPQAELNGVRVLVVDENPVSRRVLTGQLKYCQMSVREAETGT